MLPGGAKCCAPEHQTAEPRPRCDGPQEDPQGDCPGGDRQADDQIMLDPRTLLNDDEKIIIEALTALLKA